jgi:hypothetical protein
VSRPAAPPTLSVAELEDEIARTRARISHQLAVIDREYALRHLLVHASRLARSADLRPSVVAATLRRDAPPLALIGAGVAWLVLGRKDGGALDRLTDDLAHARNLATTLIALSQKTRPGSTAIAPSAEGPDGRRARPERSACRQ